eukprot:NODE_245_length_1810_cov_147.418301_g219_i0.p1 GENE.NODE_245_length_1810_cov_147.418301_g219_i0~~NODE_245_length_1810_cov_147.418301_g219_i0.p1  ORF type:complete len:556 (-),score=99.49 NODE_245_length_1810_cov_147.418301_g219_i0:86-1753(-)
MALLRCLCLALLSCTVVSIPGVHQLIFQPPKLYVDGQSDGKVIVWMNLTYHDWEGIKLDTPALGQRWISAKANLTNVVCTPSTNLPAGWKKPTGAPPKNAPVKYVQVNCTVTIPKATPAGHYQMLSMDLRSMTNDSFRPKGVDMLQALNRMMDTEMCLAPYFTITRINPANDINIKNIHVGPTKAVLDGASATVWVNVSYVAPQGMNMSAIAITFREKGNVNGTVVRNAMCNMTGSLTDGEVQCPILIPNGTKPYLYQMLTLTLMDKKGDYWNAEKLELLTTIDGDIAKYHMKQHVGHGSMFHSHLCSLPLINVVNEKATCKPTTLIKCMMNAPTCNAQSSPPCPTSSPICAAKYGFAICADQLNCYDALAVWCNGGFFQAGCAGQSWLTALCAPVAKYSRCNTAKFKDCAKGLPKGATSRYASCSDRISFNQCAFDNNCNALVRDTSDCHNLPQTQAPTGVFNAPPLPPTTILKTKTRSKLAVDEQFLTASFINSPEAHENLENADLPSQSSAGLSAVTIGIIVGVVTGLVIMAVLVAAALRIRRTSGQEYSEL